MSFEIKFSKNAVKFLRKLPQDILNRIKSKFNEISLEPFRYLKHFEGENCYKLRIGDYRGLIDVNFDKKILFVRVFDKREKVYKKL